jgi:hypothetical protein
MPIRVGYTCDRTLNRSLVFHESRMATPVYLALAVVLYAVLADRTDRAIEREMKKRQPEERDLRLVEDFDARPDLGPRYGRVLRRQPR